MQKMGGARFRFLGRLADEATASRHILVKFMTNPTVDTRLLADLGVIARYRRRPVKSGVVSSESNEEHIKTLEAARASAIGNHPAPQTTTTVSTTSCTLPSATPMTVCMHTCATRVADSMIIRHRPSGSNGSQRGPGSECGSLQFALHGSRCSSDDGAGQTEMGDDRPSRLEG